MKLNIDDKMYEFLYAYASHLNDTILKKDNKNNTLTFEEHFVFQMSSYLLAIINEQKILSATSLTTFFIYRSIIENMAVVKMFEAGDIDEGCLSLLIDYNYVIEYNIYKKYEQLNNKLFYFDQIKGNYERIFLKYKNILEYDNNKELKELLKSRLPWLKEKYSFDELIKMYCSELYETYKLLSITTHPADPYALNYMIENMKFEKLFIYISDYFVNFSNKCINDYFNINGKIHNDYFQVFCGDNNTNPNNLYMSYVNSQRMLLKDISILLLKKFKENCNSDYLLFYGEILMSIGIDKSLGFSEIIKCKMKPFLELIAGNNYQLERTQSIKGDPFFGIHTLYNMYKSIDDEKGCIDSLDYLCNRFPELSKEEIEMKMNTSLGFMDDKKTISQFIYEYIEQLQTAGINEIPTGVQDVYLIDFKDYMKLTYDEANALSHANGYMIISNSGAFNDYFYPIVMVDICILNILYKVVAALVAQAKRENINLNKLKYDIEKRIKHFRKFMELKYQLDITMSPYKISKLNS